MKAVLKWLVPLTLGLVALGVLALLIRASTGVGEEAHRLNLAAIEDVARSDSELTRAVSLAYVRNDAGSSGADVRGAVLRLRQSVTTLETGASAPGALSPELAGEVAKLRAIVDSKTRLAEAYSERLQALSAGVVDRVDATLRIVEERPVALDAVADAAIRAEAAALVRQLVSYASTASEEDRAGVQRRIEALNALVAPLGGAMTDFGERIAAATQSAVNDKQDQLNQLAAVTGSPTGIALRGLRRTYDSYHGERQAQASFYRRLLNVYTLMLILVVGWFALRLGRSFRALDAARQELVAANENLESQVRVRTEDLSRAYENLRESQTQLIQSEKMASLGQMVAGVAHEINTPLGYVRSNTGILTNTLEDLRDAVVVHARAIELIGSARASEAEIAAAVDQALRRNVSDTDALFADLRELLEDADYGLGQISELVLTLKDFSRVDRAVTDRIDLNAGLDATLKICHNLLKTHVEVVRDYGELPAIECAPSQINQVFLNLITNAAQAIKHQGQLLISTRQDGDAVLVSLRDTGIGMDESVRARIFEPFFTTKDVGQGTGLGLSIVYRIVEEHGGSIACESQPGVGTEFRVRLPLRQAHRVEHKAAA